jgi:simple sugar transport system permease protein
MNSTPRPTFTFVQAGFTPRGLTILVSAALVLGVAGCTALVLSLAGHAPGPALAALVRGSVGSGFAMETSVLRAIPLALAGLAVAVAFRAGLLNVGAEGQLIVGAIGATLMGALLGGTTSTQSAWTALPLVLGAAAAAGALWAGVAAVLRRRFGVLEVISTIMLNFIALTLVGWLVRGPLQEPTHIYPQSSALPVGQRLPALFADARVHVGAVLTVLLAVSVWWWLRSTASGFRVRAIGLNPIAAASAGGINAAQVSMRAFLLSGAIAGLAGGVELTGVTFALYENFSPGYGYTAIAVALLARLNPIGVLGTALVLGALDAGATAMQRNAGVPSVVVSVVVATLILAIVAFDVARGQWRAREAGGAAEVQA